MWLMYLLKKHGLCKYGLCKWCITFSGSVSKIREDTCDRTCVLLGSGLGFQGQRDRDKGIQDTWAHGHRGEHKGYGDRWKDERDK